jgi:hypothetical protein
MKVTKTERINIMKTRYAYCHIDTRAGIDKLEKLQRSKVWTLCGYGFNLVIFAHKVREAAL